MPIPSPRAAALLAILAALGPLADPARALVGASPDGRFADRVAMVLLRGPGEAGFCSALVLDSRTLLTAAHCVKATRDMAVHYRDASGAPVIIPVEAAVAHPLYRPDAIRARVESIDVALIRSARPLDSRFAGASLASGAGPAVGEPVILSGYGVTRDGDWKSGGRVAQRRARGARARFDRPDLGGRPGRRSRRRLLGRFRRADLVRRRPDRDRHRDLGAGAPRPRLRRPHPGPASRAAQGLDRGDGAQAGGRELETVEGESDRSGGNSRYADSVAVNRVDGPAATEREVLLFLCWPVSGQRPAGAGLALLWNGRSLANREAEARFRYTTALMSALTAIRAALDGET